MAAIKRITFGTWDEFKRDIVPALFDGGRFQSGVYLFRGCGDAGWQLVSSFDRRFAHLPAMRRLDVWARLLATFRSVCEDHGVSRTLLDDDRRLLAFGQHHGLPTRLLDWSLSPYVAAFFAFRQSLFRADLSHEVGVWVLDSRSAAWSPELGVEVVSPPAIENVRLLNQAGRFTYSRTPYLTLEEYVEQSGVDGTPLLQITLPGYEALRALPDLDAMGINAMHLFPDMSGLAEGVALRVQFDAVADVVALPR